MTDMTPRRFEVLAGAYGADLRRWPVEARDAAGRLAADQPEATGPVLDRESRLDQWLAAAPTPALAPALRERIVAAGARGRWGAPWRWLTGAALASACAAGVAAGILLAPIAGHAPGLWRGSDPADEAASLLREPQDLASVG